MNKREIANAVTTLEQLKEGLSFVVAHGDRPDLAPQKTSHKMSSTSHS